MTRLDDFESRLSGDLEAYARRADAPRDYLSAAREIVHGPTRGIRFSMFAGVTALAVLGAATAIGVVALGLPGLTGSPVVPTDTSPPPDANTREADRLFLSTRECESVIGGYRVTITYPTEWWAYGGTQGSPACVWLAPNELDVPDPLTSRPSGVVITIGAVGGGPETGGEALSSAVVVIAGRTALRVEELLVSGSRPTATLLYWVPLAPDSGGPTLVAMTEDTGGANYELNKAVLERLVSSIRITSEN